MSQASDRCHTTPLRIRYALILAVAVVGAQAAPARPARANTGTVMKAKIFAVTKSEEPRFLGPPKDYLDAGGWEGVAQPKLQVAPNGVDRVSVGVIVTDGGAAVPKAEVKFTVSAVSPKDTEYPRDVTLLKKEMRRQLPKTDPSKVDAIVDARLAGTNPVWRTRGTLVASSVRTDTDGLAQTTYTASTVTGKSAPGEETITAYLASDPTVKMEFSILVGVKLEKVDDSNFKVLKLKSTASPYASSPVKQYIVDLDSALDAAKWTTTHKRITITDISTEFGGMLPPHKGHLTGGCIDFRPVPSTDENGAVDTGYRSRPCTPTLPKPVNYDALGTYRLLEIFAVSGCGRKVFFMDPCFRHPGVILLSGHHNHIHVSWEPTYSDWAWVTNDAELEEP